MTLAEAKNIIDLLGKKYPEGFQLSMAQELGGDKLQQESEMKTFMKACNQMVKEQVMSVRAVKDGKPILIFPGKQRVGARNLNPDKQRQRGESPNMQIYEIHIRLPPLVVRLCDFIRKYVV